MESDKWAELFFGFMQNLLEVLMERGGARLGGALSRTSVSEDLLLRLSAPKSVRRFALPVRMDGGSLRLFTGLRIVYSNCFGPTKGGVRFHPSTNEADLVGLAFRLLL